MTLRGVPTVLPNNWRRGLKRALTLCSVALVLGSLQTAIAWANGAGRSPSLKAAKRFVRVGQIKIEYRSFGSGSPLLMIIGLGSSVTNWDPRLLDTLAHSHRVVVFDNRGVGASGSTSLPLSVHLMAEDTAGLIRGLRLHRPAVLGWSLGGFIAQDLAVNHPRLISRLILCATTAGGPKSIPPSPSVLSELANPVIVQGGFPDLLFPSDKVSAARQYRAAKLRWARRETATVGIIKAQLVAAVTWPGAYPALPHVHVPVLVADGTRDVIFPAQNSRQIAARIPNARLLLYPDAGHAFLFQDRAPFVRAITRFFATRHA